MSLVVLLAPPTFRLSLDTLGVSITRVKAELAFFPAIAAAEDAACGDSRGEEAEEDVKEEEGDKQRSAKGLVCGQAGPCSCCDGAVVIDEAASCGILAEGIACGGGVVGVGVCGVGERRRRLISPWLLHSPSSSSSSGHSLRGGRLQAVELLLLPQRSMAAAEATECLLLARLRVRGNIVSLLGRLATRRWGG